MCAGNDQLPDTINQGPDMRGKKQSVVDDAKCSSSASTSLRFTLSDHSCPRQLDQPEKLDNPPTEYDEILANEKNRIGWDSKTQFYMGIISYAVGIGNIWRFPYLCQKNGGGAFLIPYVIMVIFEGIPLFLIELGIGQRLRTGSVGVWNTIHPYLGGVGISASVVSFLFALYYNVIVAWCLYYMYSSFAIHLPWEECPKFNSTVIHEECTKASSPTSYFWNRQAIDSSGSIEELGGFVRHLTVSLLVAWLLIYLCVKRGIKTSGKVMYLTASFPYIVTTIFLMRAATLEGALEGIQYVFSPNLSRLLDPNVWLEAATQVFFSMGLGCGGLIAFSSYNPIRNNCKKDCIVLSVINLMTSLYTALVIFCVLGYMGEKNYSTCLDKDMSMILTVYPGRFDSLEEIKANISREEYVYWMNDNFHMTEFKLMADVTQHCSYEKILIEAAEGTGLAFVVFTEAILQFPFPPFWAILFFFMLLLLGLGTMFGTLEGIITSMNDSKLINLKKPTITALLCSIACTIGLIFVTNAGQYWVALFDHFAGSYALLCVAFFENVAVIYVYGWKRFVRDLEFMTGEKVSNFWQITWRFISPVVMFVLFFASIAKLFISMPTYFAYDKATTRQTESCYPSWVLLIALAIVLCTITPVPAVWLIRKFGFWTSKTDSSTAENTELPKGMKFFSKSRHVLERAVSSAVAEIKDAVPTKLRF